MKCSVLKRECLCLKMRAWLSKPISTINMETVLSYGFKRNCQIHKLKKKKIIKNKYQTTHSIVMLD